MRDKPEQHFTIEDIQRHVDKVEEDMRKNERTIELLNPLLIGTCIGCGTTLLDPNDPTRTCPECRRKIEQDLQEFQRKKREAQRKGKKMDGRFCITTDQLRFL